MKRVLAILAAVCIFAVSGTAPLRVQAVSGDAADNGDVELLDRLGLLPQGFDGELSGAATRADAAEFFALFYEKTEEYAARFKDIEPGSELGSAVSALCAHGIVSGNGNGEFMPDAEVTADELICMSVNVLGGKVFAEKNGGYPIGYRKAMTSVFKVKTDFSDVITVGELAKLVLKIAETEVMEQKSFGRENTYGISEGETLLKVRKGIRKLSGILDANRYTGLYTSAAKTEGAISVGGVLLKNTDTENDGFIGYYVDAYYTEDDGERFAVAVRVNKNRNKELALSDRNHLSYSDNAYTYYTENETRKKAAIGGSGFAFIYNDAACEKYESDFLVPESGTVTLIDNNGDGVYNVVLVRSYQSFAVERVSSESVILKGGGHLLFNSGDADFFFEGSDGTEIKPTDLSVGCVASVFKSEDGRLVKVICENREVTGIAEKIRKADGDTLWVIDSHEYRVVKKTAAAVNINVGMRVTARLDCFGDIADVRLWENEYWFYAYLGNFGVSAGMEKNPVFVMYDSDGEIRKTEGGARITVDGKQCRGYDEVLARLKTAAVYSDRFAENPSAANYAVTEEELAARGPEQFLRYRLSADGRVSAIDTAAPEMGDDYSQTLHMSGLSEGNGEKTAVPRLSMLGRTLAYDDSTLFFWIPKEYSERNRFYTENSGRSLIDKVKYNAVGFYTGDNMTADYITVITEGDTAVAPGDWNRMYVVSEKCRTVNEDGETINVISYYENYNSGLKEYTAEENTSGLLDGVDEGDVIRCGMYNGRIAGYEMIYDCDKQKFSGITGEYFEYPYIFAGTAYLSKGDIAAVTGENPSEGSIALSECNVYNVSKYPVMTVENGRELLIREGTASDIKSYTEFGAEASKIIVHMVGGTPITMIIIN